MINKILIVADQFGIRSRMSLLLENKLNGVFVFAVKDFKEALSACAAVIFDLVILDINLPDGRKCDMIEDLRKLQKEVKILISSIPEDIYAFRYIQAGADGYLDKVNDSNTFIKAVKAVLEKEKFIGLSLGFKTLQFIAEL